MTWRDIFTFGGILLLLVVLNTLAKHLGLLTLPEISLLILASMSTIITVVRSNA